MPDPELSSGLAESYDSIAVKEPNPYEPLESPASVATRRRGGWTGISLRGVFS